MQWSFWDYPTVRRAEQIAREAGLEARTARHALYGLLFIAEREGLADSQLTSAEVLEYLRGTLPREEEHDPAPFIDLPRETNRAWLQVFQPGQLGWRMLRETGLDPGKALAELENSQADFSSWWSDDWTLLNEMFSHHFSPLMLVLRTEEASGYEVVLRMLDWLDENRPQAPRTEPLVRPAPEPLLKDLIALLARMSSVALIYWAHGLLPPVYQGKLSIFSKFRGSPLIENPGGRLASESGHTVVFPIHQFLTGLREPRFQLDLAYASQPVRAFLAEVPDYPRAANVWLSDAALLVLQGLSSFCTSLGVEPGPLHLTWAALKTPDDLLRRALEQVDLDRLEMDLERELFGQLPDGPLAVDGVSLGAPVASLGPLRSQGESSWISERGALLTVCSEGKVTSILGRTLAYGSQALLGPEARPGEAERLLGLGRQNRWTPIYGGMLRVTTDQGVVESIGLREG